MPFARHWLSSGHSAFFLQLHSLSSRVSAPDCSSGRLFFESITLLTLGMQLYESLRVLRLKIGLRAWPLGKHSLMIRKNSFPKLVLTRASNGGLNQVTFRFLNLRFFLLFSLGWNFNVCWYPLLSNAAW